MLPEQTEQQVDEQSEEEDSRWSIGDEESMSSDSGSDGDSETDALLVIPLTKYFCIYQSDLSSLCELLPHSYARRYEQLITWVQTLTQPSLPEKHALLILHVINLFRNDPTTRETFRLNLINRLSDLQRDSTAE